MGIDSTRRDLLKLAGMGVATGAAARVASGTARFEISDPKVGQLKTWVTDDERRLTPMPPISWTKPGTAIDQDTIILAPDNKAQVMVGFGAALTDGACYLFSQLADDSRTALFHDLFHPTQMGLSVCRTTIGSSDNSRTVYSYNDGDADPELKRFSIEHDRAYILPILRQARSVNPDMFLFASPWSPPGWMKDNGSMLGGCMRHTHMPSYANYFVKFVQSYEAEGVPVHAITIQNEVDADQQGLMPACFWPQDYEADFVRHHLGPRFEISGIKAKIWIIDHNYNLWGRAIAELETTGVRKYTNAVAWHGYTGEPEWMSRVQDAFPDVEMYWTEGSPDHNDPEYLKCWVSWAQKFVGILRNSCRAITGWSFATDEHGGPNVGPYPLGGMVTIDSKTRAIYHSGQYWAMGHFSRFVRRGAIRIGSEGTSKDVAHCAFQNPDGPLVLVVVNSGPSRTCEIRLHNKTAKLSLSPNSVTTVTCAEDASA